MKEVEAKAHVDFLDLETIIIGLDMEYGKSDKVEKDDSYYKDEAGFVFRVRNENGRYVRTEKTSRVKDGFESNDEIEYGISKADAILYEAKCELVIRKSKKGFRHTTEFKGCEANIELFEVGKLGLFLEVEVLLPSDSPFEDEAREWIMAIFKKFGLEKRLEPRKYIEMLKI